VVRAAYAWNLAVELARQGVSATLLAPDPAQAEAGLLWPEAGRGPVGAEVVLSQARSLADLNRAALDIAVSRAADSPEGGVVLVSAPTAWFRGASDGRALLQWVLLFAAAESRDLMETYGLTKRILAANGNARVGITIHGVRCVGDARGAFQRLAGVAARHLDRSLTSYGLLVDDLHVYRAIVSRRPIGLEHPQSRAARALRDVARLLLADTRREAVA
jgi:MinD-like ATPase involved in chromosome partitioning or flagellar assembly